MDPLTLGGYALALLLGVFGFKMKRGDVWKEEADAYKSKAERLEASVVELRAEFVRYKEDTDARINGLEIENKRLAELASSRDAVISLGETLSTYHAQIMAALGVATGERNANAAATAGAAAGAAVSAATNAAVAVTTAATKT